MLHQDQRALKLMCASLRASPYYHATHIVIRQHSITSPGSTNNLVIIIIAFLPYPGCPVSYGQEVLGEEWIALQ